MSQVCIVSKQDKPYRWLVPQLVWLIASILSNLYIMYALILGKEFSNK